MDNDNKALVALMDLVLAMADALEAPTATQRAKARWRMAAERREVAGWRETLYLLGTEANRQALEASVRQARSNPMLNCPGCGASDQQPCRGISTDCRTRNNDALPCDGQERATRRAGLGAVVSDGAEAKAAVEVSRRRYDAWLRGLGKTTVLVDPIEVDDSRVTDGHQDDPYAGCTCSWCEQRRATKSHAPVVHLDLRPKADGHQCCGGKPDCGCRSVGG
jgi:hypothetical protein